LWTGFTSFLSGVWNNITSAVTSGWNNISNFLSNTWRNIVTGAQNAWNGLVGFIRGIPGAILNALGNLGSLLVNAGRDVVTGLWNGIAGMGSWLYNNIMNWVRATIPGPILQFLGIRSPSTYMRDEIGQHIPTGLAEGILKTAPAAAAAARQMAQNVANAAASVGLPAVGSTVADINRANQARELGLAPGSSERDLIAARAAIGARLSQGPDYAALRQANAQPTTGTHIENLTINMQAIADLSNPSALNQSAKTFVSQMRQAIRVQEAQYS
jgi:phage-related protein